MDEWQTDVNCEDFMYEQPSEADVPLYAFYRRFGPSGEIIIREFLQQAKPSQLVELLSDSPSFRSICHMPIRSWSLADSVPADQVQPLLDIIGWFPEFHRRFAPLVWKAGDMLQMTSLLAMTWKFEERTLQPILDFDVPHASGGTACILASVKEEDVVRLGNAGVAFPLAKVTLEQFELVTQKLLLDGHWDDLGALVDFSPQVTETLKATWIVFWSCCLPQIRC